MQRSQSLHGRRPPPYDTYQRRSQPYTLYGRELFLPKPGNTPSFHSSNRMDPRMNPRIDPQAQRKDGASSPQEKRESKSFKKLVHNFMGYTSAHGIGRLAESKTIFWKIVWSLVCMGAFSMFIYQFIGLFQQFLSKPVSTSVSVTFEKRLPFPAVTICNLNMIRKDAMPQTVKDALKTKYDYSWSSTDDSETTRRRRNVPSTDSPSTDTSGTAPSGTVPSGTDAYGTDAYSTNTYGTDTSGTAPSGTGTSDKDTYGTDAPTTDYSDQDYSGDSYYKDDEYSDYRDDAKEYGSGYENYDEDEEEEFPDLNTVSEETKLRIEIDRLIGSLDEADLYDSGHLFDVLIRNCTWKGIDCKSGNISKYWSREWNYKYGNCFTFNRGIDEEGKPQRVFRATKPGPSQGLSLEIDVQQEQYIGALTVEAGIRVLLHDQGHMTFPYEEGFSVSPGMATSVGIKKTQIIRLDRYNNKSCLPEDELPMTNIYRRYKNITTYSQQACLKSCLGLSQRIRCKCSENAFPSDRDPCDVFDSKTSTCLRTVKYLFNNDRLSCLADCRQPCTEEVIQKTISSSQWPSKAYKDYLISQNKYHNESDNMLQLNVFFNELNYEKIEEQFSYGTINLLADVGGQLGLWIGISVITVCELLELIVMFFAVCIKKINAVSEVHEVPAYG